MFRVSCVALVLFATAVLLGGCSSSNPSEPGGGSNFAVTGVAPSGAGPGETVTVTGIGFGDGTRASQVVFGSTSAETINSWSDTEIEVVVPTGLPTWAFIDVLVRKGRADSDAWSWLSLPLGWRRITDNGTNDCYDLCWADGDVLYFSSTRAEATNFDCYFTYADDGTPTTQLTFGSGYDGMPAGQNINWAYVSQSGDATNLHVYHGMSHLQVTNDDYDDRWPDFNPAPAATYEIAFSKGVWNELQQITEWFIYGWSSGVGPDPITLSVGGDFQPSWGPDGDNVAFMRGSSIHKVEVATHNVTQLTSGHSDACPDWGDDGQILWVRAQDEIWTMDEDGKNQTMLVDPPGFIQSAVWSNNMDRIAMIILLMGAYDIYIYDT